MIKVFIGGSRKIARLPEPVLERLNNIIEKRLTVLVGDANGADRLVQQYLPSQSYRDVIVYCVARDCRNNIGHWDIQPVEPKSNHKDFNYYVAKDVQMATDASHGLMLWDAKSNGTLNNMINLLEKQKKVVVYFAPEKAFYTLSALDELNHLLAKCDKKSLASFEKKLNLAQVLGGDPAAPLFA